MLFMRLRAKLATRRTGRPKLAPRLIHIIFSAAIISMWLTLPSTVDAANTATWCKWPWPWPTTVNYEIVSSHFTADHANRIQYGGNAWSEGNFNLILQRDLYGSRPNRVVKGNPDPSRPNVIARTAVGVIDCHVDPSPQPYRTITQITTTFHNNVNWYSDCLAAGPTYCQTNNMYDLHNVAAHEFGHWFFLLDTYDSADSADTMFGWISFGETLKRTLNWHDRHQAWVMYGCRNGGSTYWC